MKGMILFCSLTYCSLLSANIYYVAPDGNDSNPGTKDQPWETWGKGFSSTSPGDTVYFRGGVYPISVTNGQGYNKMNSGTITDITCYFAFPGEVPILDCDAAIPSYGSGYQNFAINVRASYVHYKGLTIRNVWQADGDDEVVAWFMTGTNIIVENCVIYNTHGLAFKASLCYDTYFINCDAYNNCDSLTTVPAQNPKPGNDGTGFQDFNWSDKECSVYYKNCRAWNNGDQGFSSGSIGYTEYDNCWSFRNGQLQGGGHGFKMGWIEYPGKPLNRLYKNCIAAYNRAYGFTTNDQGYQCGAMNIYNNIAYHNGYYDEWANPSSGFYIYNTEDTDDRELLRVYKNNISYENENGALIAGKYALYTHDHNSWDIPVTLTPADFESLDSTGILGPRQPDGSLPDLKGFLKLSPASKANDFGVKLGFSYNNIAPYLGVWESDKQSNGNFFPSVEITYPSNDKEFGAPATITLIASAEDMDGSIQKVEFFNGKTKLGEKISSPWSFTWSNVPVGNYSLIAVATDNMDAKATTALLNINVKKNKLPNIEIIYPSDGDEFGEPANFTITANATDTDGSISKVEFFNGEAKLVEKISFPWSFIWNSVPLGDYSLTAVATDDLDGEITSSPVNVKVISGIKLYPNPNNGIFTIALSKSPQNIENKIIIISVEGKVIFTDILLQEELIKQFDLSYINTGFYIFKFSGDKTILPIDFIKE